MISQTGLTYDGARQIRPQNPSLSDIERAINKCIDFLWNVPGGLNIRLDSLLPTTSAGSGKASFSYSFSLEGPVRSATVTNSIKYSAQELGNLRAYVITGGKVTQGDPSLGWTASGTFDIVMEGEKVTFGPYTNYTASDRNRYSSAFPWLQQAIGGYLDTQIHELGNSIAIITGKNVGNLSNEFDKDSGHQLEGCVSASLSP